MDELYRAKLVAEPPRPPNLFPGFKAPQPQPGPEPRGLNASYFAAAPAPMHEPPVVVNVAAAPASEVSRDKPRGGSGNKQHPLVWFSLTMSLLALVLTVPKGTLPTLTNRHKALRAKEKALDEQQLVLSHLTSFLSEPLGALVANPAAVAASPSILRALKPVPKVWHVESFEQEHAKVVKISGFGSEAWVIHTDVGDDALKLLLHPEQKASHEGSMAVSDFQRGLERHDVQQDDKRLKQRHAELENREIEVLRREQWVVEEMRKLSDKIHSQADELTLEDRITERLKSYQRQLQSRGDNSHHNDP